MRWPVDTARDRWSDHELLAGIADCDRDACSVFYRRHLSRTLGYLLRATQDREVAADLTAEVFAAVLLSAKRYRPQRGTAGPWVLGIARNVLGASRRRGRVEARARRQLGFEALEFDDSDLERTEALTEGGGGILALVELLPGNERDAVVARVVDEMGYAETAGKMRCSGLVVRKRVAVPRPSHICTTICSISTTRIPAKTGHRCGFSSASSRP